GEVLRVAAKLRANTSGSVLDVRTSGILLHPTSLPDGRLSSAGAFLDWLERAKQSWWQMLPVVPPGYGRSPYSAQSAFAGSPELLEPSDERPSRQALARFREENEE